MTIRELEDFLVREKGVATTKLGYEMCGKYARCLFCAKSEEYPCAGAHNRLIAAVNNASVQLPAWLLPEPPLPGEARFVPQPVVATPAEAVPPVSAPAEALPVRQTEGPFVQPQPAPQRAQGGVIVRARTYEGVPLLKFRKK